MTDRTRPLAKSTLGSHPSADLASPMSGRRFRGSSCGSGLCAIFELVPGALVRHPERPDWGLGQVQSVVGPRVTVNFENRGKVLINSREVDLEVIDEEPAS